MVLRRVLKSSIWDASEGSLHKTAVLQKQALLFVIISAIRWEQSKVTSLLSYQKRTFYLYLSICSVGEASCVRNCMGWCMHTSTQDHRRVSESFSAPLNVELPGQAFPFSLDQNPDPFQIISFVLESYPQPQKSLLQTCSLSKRGFWAAPLLTQEITPLLRGNMEGKGTEGSKLY